MNAKSSLSFDVLQSFENNNQKYFYYSLPALQALLPPSAPKIDQLPFTLKILLENLLRHQDNMTVTKPDVAAIVDWLKTGNSSQEIAYRPARVLMQDFTGVPAIVDLAAMRTGLAKRAGDPNKINPLVAVDLVIDHSVQVDKYATPTALKINTSIEVERNHERYEFLRWGQTAFANFRVVPPGTGICHQVNLEYLAKCVWQKPLPEGTLLYPDTLVGTDSHTTMINGLGVLGWGVGGIEAEAAMLGQPISMLLPEVIGFNLTGTLNEGITATDLVLTVTQILREKGVVSKFVEFFGPGLDHLPLADRATIANMAPEYGATCGFFPIDQITVDYLKLTGRDKETIELVEHYSKIQGLWRDSQTSPPIFTDTLELNLSTVKPSLAGPKRPQDKVYLGDLANTFEAFIQTEKRANELTKTYPVAHNSYQLKHGSVVIAAITSCTNTSNPQVLITAGLLAKKALEKGLQRKPWVKSSLAPGSKVVTNYLQQGGLLNFLEDLGFYLVGYGCTTCIGNSGPLEENISETITENDLIVSAVLSGNRNFEGRIHPLVKANWLASPPLVVAFALAGTTHIDLTTEPLGSDPQGQPVYLKDIWPSNQEVAEQMTKIDAQMFRREYADVFKGDVLWENLVTETKDTYEWPEESTYIQYPPFFEDLPNQKLQQLKDIENANILAILGDSITTDHISPAGSIKKDSPAGKYLQEKGITPAEFNSYGARRGNHFVMMRGTFANIRIRNEMIPGVEGGFTRHIPSGEILSIYDAAMEYQKTQTPLIIIAGKEYGTGSSRDWAAKGARLLGVKAVIAESFERIHRSNLIGMGVLPLLFTYGQSRLSLQLTGVETFIIPSIANLKPKGMVMAMIKKPNGEQFEIQLRSAIDTHTELNYFLAGGILQFVLNNLAEA